MSRTRRYAVAAALLAGLLLTLAANITTYSGLNAGLVIGPPGYSVGIEWRGEPGTYADFDGVDNDAR
ncbi:hypothetical protein G3I60_04950 [Streptomyces sp. SID13666]|uniref:hypothetical protein n=1 Tax=Streptomyces sp. SID13666 TaxID=2706054 RepID=UPI0013C17C2D|nr:hypothetical protein [Streptomyces sp. SID13666]NEA53517.1 hypothetical protein [Streptomyces sp. SID13666]